MDVTELAADWDKKLCRLCSCSVGCVTGESYEETWVNVIMFTLCSTYEADTCDLSAAERRRLNVLCIRHQMLVLHGRRDANRYN